jgi:carboxypeptidase family protein
MSRRLIWFLVLLSLTPVLLQAQGSSVGNITGSVVDPSGSAVPGATISIRNVNTNQTRETRTGDAGLYTVSSLAVGDYQLTATAPGFQKVEITEIKLDVNATLRVDVSMTVGQVTETVEVAAQAPLLNTENASTGQIIGAKRVTELPLNGRDFQQLQLLTPGNISGTNFQTSQGLSGGASSLTTTGTMNVSNGASV